MEKVSRLTRNVFVKKGMNRATNAALICHVAKRSLNDFFKKSFLKEIEIVSFRDEILFITTSSPTYSQEIKLKEKDILDKINLELGKDLVSKIRFRINKH